MSAWKVVVLDDAFSWANVHPDSNVKAILFASKQFVWILIPIAVRIVPRHFYIFSINNLSKFCRSAWNRRNALRDGDAFSKNVAVSVIFKIFLFNHFHKKTFLECQSKNDCEFGWPCSMGKCQAKTCSKDSECPENWICSSTRRCARKSKKIWENQIGKQNIYPFNEGMNNFHNLMLKANINLNEWMEFTGQFWRINII